MTGIITLSQLVEAYERAGVDLMRADYLDSDARADQVRSAAQARLKALDKVMLPHSGPLCPVMPGTPVLIRFMGSLVTTSVPERQDWNLITEWRPNA